MALASASSSIRPPINHLLHQCLRTHRRASALTATLSRSNTLLLPTRYRPSHRSHIQPRHQTRFFTTTPHPQSWLHPRRELTTKDRKGRPRLPLHGSTRGTTVIYGTYGLRLRSHDLRISNAQLKNGEDVIRRRMRGVPYRLFMRISANVAVYKKGNESRMGTGKGKFDHWGARVGVSRVVFEISADCHEEVVRDALRLAGNKLPGLWEFVRKGDAPVMGVTKLGEGVVAEDLLRPRRKLLGEVRAGRLPSASS